MPNDQLILANIFIFYDALEFLCNSGLSNVKPPLDKKSQLSTNVQWSKSSAGVILTWIHTLFICTQLPLFLLSSRQNMNYNAKMNYFLISSKEFVLITEIFWRIFWCDNWRWLIGVVENFRFWVLVIFCLTLMSESLIFGRLEWCFSHYVWYLWHFWELVFNCCLIGSKICFQQIASMGWSKLCPAVCVFRVSCFGLFGFQSREWGSLEFI